MSVTKKRKDGGTQRKDHLMGVTEQQRDIHELGGAIYKLKAIVDDRKTKSNEENVPNKEDHLDERCRRWKTLVKRNAFTTKGNDLFSTIDSCEVLC